MKNVSLLGVNHISKESTERIISAVERLQPDIICVELDTQRSQSLDSRTFPRLSFLRKVGIFGYIFAVIGYVIQGFLGRKTGVMPGDEMKTAIRIANEKNITVALIDRPIERTLYRLRKVPWKERFRVLSDALLRKTPSISFDPSSIPNPETLQPLLTFFSSRYPYLANVLLHERDAFMAQKIREVLVSNDTVLVIIGAAHLPGVQEQLNT